MTEQKVETADNLTDNSQTETAAKEYIPSDEEYRRTFEDIERLIHRLNAIIIDRNYEKWLSYLTKEYMEKKGDPEYLKRLSDMPTLVQSGIILWTLKDYFYQVVVPSRYKATLDEIVFLDADHIKAYTYINEEPVILYYLEKIEGEWKITHWE